MRKGISIFVLLLSLPLFASASSSHTKSCVQDFCQKIMALPEGAEISISKDVSPNEVAEALVSRIRQQEISSPEFLSPPVHVALDLENDTQIMLFFWVEDLQSIQEKGFLNQHQIGKSNGTFDPRSRVETEDNILGLGLGSDERALLLRPKSAFLNVLTQTDLGPKIRYIVSPEAYDPPNGKRRGGYGNVAAVFKPSVRSRALWTVDDSWWLGMEKRSDRDLLPLRGTFDRGSLPKMTLERNSYFEALIFGSLTMNDVDYFITLNDVVVPALSRAKKPVYLADRTQEFGRYVFRRTRLLYDPLNSAN